MTGDTSLRSYIFDDLFAHRYDANILDEAPPRLRALYRRLPPWLSLALEVQRRHNEYDVIVTWSEHISMALMAIQALTRTRKPHVAMMYWLSRPTVRASMLALGKSVHAIVTWTSVQRRYAIDELGVPPSKIYLVKHFVDTLFWCTRGDAAAPTEGICAAGAERRDYPTLIEALRGTDLRCHIATDHVRVIGVGILVGLPASFLVSRLVGGMVVGVKPTDPTTVISAAVLLVLVGVAAAVIPARRAARLDPITSIHAE
jgi:hypothetical protein